MDQPLIPAGVSAPSALAVHRFVGVHLLLAYEDCTADLNDLDFLEAAMRQGIAAAGATVVDWAGSRFVPQGLTLAFVLAESHASLHTYPEYHAAFLDIFTCGTHCQPAQFDAVLRQMLRPAVVRVQVVQR